MDEREVKFKELLKDQKTLREIMAITDPQMMRNFFAERGLSFTLDEVKAISGCLNRAQGFKGELSEEKLEEVSGGCVSWIAAALENSVALMSIPS